MEGRHCAAFWTIGTAADSMTARQRLRFPEGEGEAKCERDADAPLRVVSSYTGAGVVAQRAVCGQGDVFLLPLLVQRAAAPLPQDALRKHNKTEWAISLSLGDSTESTPGIEKPPPQLHSGSSHQIKRRIGWTETSTRSSSRIRRKTNESNILVGGISPHLGGHECFETAADPSKAVSMPPSFFPQKWWAGRRRTPSL